MRFHCGNAFTHEDRTPSGRYDLIYDSGCFHHLPPHRRVSDRALLDRLLAPRRPLRSGVLRGGREGSQVGDADLYRRPSLDGGLGYSSESLRRIFSDLEEIEQRRMRDEPPGSPYFGESFLWTALIRRADSPPVISSAPAG